MLTEDIHILHTLKQICIYSTQNKHRPAHIKTRCTQQISTTYVNLLFQTYACFMLILCLPLHSGQLYPSDDEIVHTLLSYEHLKAMCKIKEEGSSVSPHVVPSSKISISESITNLPFSLDILHLIPKCRQLELICSTFLDG